jgi:hypothetical protein
MTAVQQIFQVDSVTLSLNKKLPPDLIVEAEGMCSTSDWKDGELNPYVYITPPADGIQEFDFVATPPTGISRPVLTPIEASHIMRDMPDWVRGVRIYAESNQAEESLVAEKR